MSHWCTRASVRALREACFVRTTSAIRGRAALSAGREVRSEPQTFWVPHETRLCPCKSQTRDTALRIAAAAQQRTQSHALLWPPASAPARAAAAARHGPIQLIRSTHLWPGRPSRPPARSVPELRKLRCVSSIYCNGALCIHGHRVARTAARGAHVRRRALALLLLAQAIPADQPLDVLRLEDGQARLARRCERECCKLDCRACVSTVRRRLSRATHPSRRRGSWRRASCRAS